MKNVSDLLRSQRETERREGILFVARDPTRENLLLLAEMAEADESLEVRFLARKGLHQLKRVKGAADPTPDQPGKVTPEQIRAYFEGTEENKFAIIEFAIKKNCLPALPVFIEQLARETDPQLVASILMAIGRLGSEGEIRAIVPYLSHETPRVRANAVEALELLGTVKAYPYILSMLKDTDNRVKANAVKAVRALSPASTIRILRQMVTSNYFAMQASAAFALAFFPDEENVPLLAGLLDSTEETVRENAVKTLAHYARKEVPGATQALEKGAPEALADLENVARPAAIVADPPPKPSALADALLSGDAEVRLQGVQEAVRSGDQTMARAMVKHLQQGEPDRRVVATILLGLGRLQIQSATPLLVRGLGSSDARTRANCIEALRLLNNPEALRAVIPLLADPSNRARANAILALKDFPGVNILEPLRSLLAEPDLHSQKSGVFAILEMKSVPAFRLLHEAARSPHPEVASLAQKALQELADRGVKIQPPGGPGEHAPPPPPPTATPTPAPTSEPMPAPAPTPAAAPIAAPAPRRTPAPPPVPSPKEPPSAMAPGPEPSAPVPTPPPAPPPPADFLAGLVTGPAFAGWQPVAVEKLAFPLPGDWKNVAAKPSLLFLPPNGKELRLRSSGRTIPKVSLTVTMGTTPNDAIDAKAILERRREDFQQFFEGFRCFGMRTGGEPGGTRFLFLNFDHTLEKEPFTTSSLIILEGNVLAALDFTASRDSRDAIRPVFQQVLSGLHLGTNLLGGDLAPLVYGEFPAGDSASWAAPTPGSEASPPSPFEENGLWGFRGSAGQTVIPPTLEKAEPFRGGLARVVTQGRCRFLDASGRTTFSPQFTLADEFAESLALVRIGDEWGYMDVEGNVVVKPLFAQVALMLFLFDAEMNWEIRCLEPAVS